MLEYLFGKYASDYEDIIKLYSFDGSSFIEDDSPVKKYVAINKMDKEVFLKVIDKNILKEEVDYNFQIERVRKEIEISYLCDSNYTLKLYKDLETDNTIILENEYLEYTLKDYLFNYGNLEYELETFKEIIIGLAKSLVMLNSKGVVHRDIKPDNIYITKPDNGQIYVKLGNFNSALFIKDIKNSEPTGAFFYTAPEILNNHYYDEKCDMWSLGITLFELYFGFLPYGIHPSLKKLYEMIDDQKSFIYSKSNIPTLDILFKRLLQINPNNRMSISEFYDYVNDKNFLNGDFLPMNNPEKYIFLYEEIKKEKQVEYRMDCYRDGMKELKKIINLFHLAGNEEIPDIMNYPNAKVNEQEIYNNIIYFNNKTEKDKNLNYIYVDKLEKMTPGAFIFCSNIDSLKIIKDEILRYKKYQKNVVFNIISNGRSYESIIKPILEENKDFKECINKLCIFSKNIQKYIKYKEENKEFIYDVTDDINVVIKFIMQLSSKDIKPFPLTKLVTLHNYLDKYKERHKKVSEFYGYSTEDNYQKNNEELNKSINIEEKAKSLKLKKFKILKKFMALDFIEFLGNVNKLIYNQYTENTFNGNFNRRLMKIKSEYYEIVAFIISRLLYSLNAHAVHLNLYCKENNKIFHYKTKLYYSCLLPYERAVGKIIMLSKFILTSEKEEIIKSYSKEEQALNNEEEFVVIFHITNKFLDTTWIPNCIEVNKYYSEEEEDKFLFLPFSFYKVKKVDIDLKNYKAEIFLEAIGKKEILEQKIKLGKEIKYNEKDNIMEIVK